MPTVWISAGDASGDAIGADFVRALDALRPGLRFVGVGGEEMARAGVDRVADQEALAIGGLIEWVPSTGRLLALWARVIRGLRRERPALVVVIDSGGFHLPFLWLARRLVRTRTLYYVAPQVWVWRAGRLKRIAARSDRVAVVWPFEPGFYAERGARADFVGHPILDRAVAALPPAEARNAARQALGVAADRALLGLFPGSRRNEIANHLPIQLETFRRLRATHPELEGVLVRAPSVAAEVLAARIEEAGGAPGLRIVDSDPRWLDALDVALTKPGTITLELLLRARPMVVMGRAHPFSVWLTRSQFVSERLALPNRIAEADVVPECLQEEATPDRIAARLAPLLPGPDGPSGAAREQIDALRAARDRLGAPGASRRAAAIGEELLGTDRT